MLTGSAKKSTMAAVQCGKVVEGGCAAVRVEPLDEGVGRFAIRLAMVEVLTIVRKRIELPESAADFFTKVGWFLRRVL